MKVEIYPFGCGWKFSVWLGGLEVESNFYETHRGVVRGIKAWWSRAANEVCDQGTTDVTPAIERAIRESRKP